MLYFDIHVFINRKEGYSVFLKVNEGDLPDNYDDVFVVNVAVERKILEESDSNMVDYIDEINEQDYNDAIGIA